MFGKGRPLKNILKVNGWFLCLSHLKLNYAGFTWFKWPNSDSFKGHILHPQHEHVSRKRQEIRYYQIGFRLPCVAIIWVCQCAWHYNITENADQCCIHHASARAHSLSSVLKCELFYSVLPLSDPTEQMMNTLMLFHADWHNFSGKLQSALFF